MHLDQYELRRRVVDRYRRWQFHRYALDIELFQRAARVAQRPDHFASLRLPPDEERVFRLEKDATFWDEGGIRVPIALCCMAAIVQGWTQSSSNAANLYYPKALGMTVNGGNTIADKYQWLFNVQNAAPFLSGSLAGCWLSDPLNEWFYGRRGAIFFAAIFTLIAVVGSAFSQTKWQLLVFRIILGLGMGAKASVVPIYAAEISPAKLRGRLVINWQVFTALGIFLAFTVNLIFARDIDNGWRVMFGSGLVPTIAFISLVLVCPESPRFLMKRGMYYDAYCSFLRLRGSPIAAAKEMITLDAQLQAAEAQLIRPRRRTNNVDAEAQPAAVEEVESEFEDEEIEDDFESIDESENGEEQRRPAPNGAGSTVRVAEQIDGPRGFKERFIVFWTNMWLDRSNSRDTETRDPFVLQFRNTNYLKRVWSLLSHPRTARASLAAFVVMWSQQLCGINILAFYSTSLFTGKGELTTSLIPLWYSWGFGITNFLFSFPTYFLVDKKGRRWLLLWTFPPMAICLLITGLLYDDHRGASYAFIIIFTAIYSFGAGPVPFAYSAEVYPLTNREAGEFNI